MAVIHLEFDVDSDVHPELHAMLSSIGSDVSQGERLRQLAATGLVWETFRLQGPPASVFVAPPDQAADATTLPASAPSSNDPPAHREIEREVESTARELPVLFDVVHPDEASRLIAATGKHSANAAAAASSPSNQVVDFRERAAADLANGPGHVSAIPQKTPTRPRLMRMKEKGLFKNG